MIRLEDARALWFMPVELNRSDWLGAVCLEGGSFVIRYRMRYYRDDKAHGSKDERVWFEARGREGITESECIDKMRTMVSTLSQFAEAPYTEILRGEHDTAWFMEELSKQSWAHTEVKEL